MKVIMDNCKGFDTTESSSGIGFKNLESRIQFLNGKYRIRSKIGKGTSVIILFTNKNVKKWKK